MACAARFFVDGHYAQGDSVELCASDARKILLVLRFKQGDGIEVIDSSGRIFAASVHLQSGVVHALLEVERERPAEATLRITLAQGIPKGQKMDFVVEKATELGVVRIIPFVGQRTIDPGSRTGKAQRWRRLARAAAQQSGRTLVPQVEDPMQWQALIAHMPIYDVVLLAWELAERTALRATLPGLIAGAREVLVVIGPEGGISHAQAQEAFTAGARALSLGPRILRTETAGLVMCAVLLYAAAEL